MILYFEDEAEAGFEFDAEKEAKSVIEEVLNEEKCPFDVQVSLYLVDHETIREMNRENRDIDRETDVLSFPGLQFNAPSDFHIEKEELADSMDPQTNTVMLGEIVICVQKVREQAESYGHGLKREFCFLVAHSMLHLCGYDHMSEAQAKEMEEKQEYILQKLQITRENS